MTRSKSKKRSNIRKNNQALTKLLFSPDMISVPDFKPDDPGRRCVASTHDGDWLVFLDKPPDQYSFKDLYQCFLWNPHLLTKVQLPCLDPYRGGHLKCLVSCYIMPYHIPLGGGQQHQTERCCYRVYFFSRLGGVPHYLWCSDEFGQWRTEMLGIEDWWEEGDYLEDVVLFPGDTTECFSGITRFGWFHGSNKWLFAPSESVQGDNHTLVVYHGEERDQLFLLQGKMCPWEVWEIDISKRSWVSISNLEGIVVFLNETHSVAYSHPQLEGNCIFFTGFGDTENFYVFWLADKSVSVFKNQPHSEFPAWFPNPTIHASPWLSFEEKDVPIIEEQAVSVKLIIPDDNVMNVMNELTPLGSSESCADHVMNELTPLGSSESCADHVMNELTPLGSSESCADHVMNELTLLGSSESCGVHANAYLELPHNLQWFIAEYLHSAMDYANLRLVCRKLRETVPPIHWKPEFSTSVAIQFPWLILFNEKELCSCVIDPICNMRYYYRNQELSGCKIRYCKDGWLLVTQGTQTVFFFEPFSKTKINLPNLPKGFHVAAMSFSSSPTSSGWIIISTLSRHHRVLYLRSTSDSWRIFYPIEFEFFGFSNHTGSSPVFHDHSFYLLLWHGKVVKIWWDEEGHELRFCTWKPNVRPILDPDFHAGYLVSCENDLYLVVVAPTGKTVNMYKQDEAASEWDQVETTENFSFFISETSSIAVPVSQQSQEKTVNLSLFASDNGHHLSYHMGTKEFRCSDGDGSRRREIYERTVFTNGTWIQPQVTRGYRYS